MTQNERPKVGVGVIVQRGEKILLGFRLDGHGAGRWQIPGGHLEFGESFAEAGAREVTEEAGLTDIKIVRVVSLGNERLFEKHYVTIGLLAESKMGEPYAAEPDKSSEWDWYDPHVLPQPMFPHSERVIQNWLAGAICDDLL